MFRPLPPRRGRPLRVPSRILQAGSTSAEKPDVAVRTGPCGATMTTGRGANLQRRKPLNGLSIKPAPN
eukprot:scaffold603649_cov36-Prasinocladus_malaysianus.AAC.1